MQLLPSQSYPRHLVIMNGDVSSVKDYEARLSGSPIRVVKADPDLVSDVSISCSTPTHQNFPERTFVDDVNLDAIMSEIPSDDEEG